MAHKVFALCGFNAVELFARFAVENIERPAGPAFKEQYLRCARAIAATVAAGLYRGFPEHCAIRRCGSYGKAAIRQTDRPCVLLRAFAAGFSGQYVTTG